jgi:hypothetical protein
VAPERKGAGERAEAHREDEDERPDDLRDRPEHVEHWRGVVPPAKVLSRVENAAEEHGTGGQGRERQRHGGRHTSTDQRDRERLERISAGFVQGRGREIGREELLGVYRHSAEALDVEEHVEDVQHVGCPEAAVSPGSVEL